MRHSASWEASSSSGSLEIPPHLWDTKVHCSVQYSFRKSSSFFVILSQTNTVQKYPFTVIFYSHLRLNLPSGLFTSRFPSKTLHSFTCVLPHIATSTAHLIFLDFIARRISCEEYIPRSSEVCSVLKPPDASSHLCPNVFVSILLSNTITFY